MCACVLQRYIYEQPSTIYNLFTWLMMFFLLIIVLYFFIIVYTPVPMVFVSVFTLVHCFRGILFVITKSCLYSSCLALCE